MSLPTLADVKKAREQIAPFVARTPLVRSLPLSERLSARGAGSGGAGLNSNAAEVFLKLEVEQPTGSFKVRGAANKILSLTDEERARGVVAVSTGNHGRAVAHVASRLGVRAAVCLSELVPPGKVEAVREAGAELHIHGKGQDQAFERAAELVEEEGLTLVPPFDDPAVVAGQGTIGLELLEEQPALDVALVPLSGGGLLGGVALALKGLRPDIKVVGVSAARVSVMLQSLRAGRPVEVAEEPSLADSLGGGIGLENRVTFPLVRDLVDEHVVVDEEEIEAAMAFAFAEHGLVLEGAAAVGIAALLRETDRRPALDGTIAVVLSGQNVEADRFDAISGRVREGA